MLTHGFYLRNYMECIWMKVEVNSTLNITNINPQCHFPEIAEFKTTLTPGRRPIEFNMIISESFPGYQSTEEPAKSYPALMFYVNGVFTTHFGPEAYVITFHEITSLGNDKFASVVWDIFRTQSRGMGISFTNGRIMFPRVRMLGSSKEYNRLSNFMTPIEDACDQRIIGHIPDFTDSGSQLHKEVVRTPLAPYVMQSTSSRTARYCGFIAKPASSTDPKTGAPLGRLILDLDRDHCKKSRYSENLKPILVSLVLSSTNFCQESFFR